MDKYLNWARELQSIAHAGLNIVVKKIIAVQNSAKHNLTNEIFSVVKIFYLCHSTGGEFVPNIETTERKYFAQDELPELDESRSNLEQLKLCFAANRADVWEAQFD